MTNGELVSQIVGIIRALNKDDRIPRRTILRAAINTSTTLHSQKLLDKTLFREENLFTKLECVELIPDPPKKCTKGFPNCNQLMRSKDKLPRTIYSRFGNSVVSVTNVTDSIEFSRKFYEDTTTKQSSRYASLVKKTPSYFTFDDYLYIMDYPIEAVNVVLFAIQRDDTDGSATGGNGECTSIWDMTFVCSDKMLMTVLDTTVQKLLVTRQLVEDENPNLNSNEK